MGTFIQNISHQNEFRILIPAFYFTFKLNPLPEAGVNISNYIRRQCFISLN